MSIDFSEELKRFLYAGESLDGALDGIRSNGASIVESIKAVCVVRACGLAEAKLLVVNSPAWADMKDKNEKFHEEIERAIKEWDVDEKF